MVPTKDKVASVSGAFKIGNDKVVTNGHLEIQIFNYLLSTIHTGSPSSGHRQHDIA